MKRMLYIALSCLLFASLTTSALANEWGLRGGVYDIVTTDDRYEGYTCPTADADDGNHLLNDVHVNHAILQNRYHAQLVAAYRDGNVWKADTIATTAVYQPGDKRGEFPNSPRLEHIPGGFQLSYGDSERYTFYQEGGEYILGYVEYITSPYFSDSYIPQDDGLLFWQSGHNDSFLPVGDALWVTDGITLGEFNITQTPRTMMEVRRLNATSAALTLDAPLLTGVDAYAGDPKGLMLPVYSAPDADSYRSGSGKAAVSLKGQVQVFGTENGWTLIQYEVSPRTCRFGFVEGELVQDAPLLFAGTPLVAAVDTFLTDDPFVSQFAQADIPAGAELTGLARCGEYYAYVEYKADKLYRGFVPMKDVHPLYDRTLPGDHVFADVRWDVMDALTGKWEVAYDVPRMILYTNGMYRENMPGEGIAPRFEANYRVYDREDGSYDFVVYTEDNQEIRSILTLNEDATITLTTTEGVQTFRRDEYSTYGNG